MPLDPFSAGFLSSLAANLATQLLNGAGKRTRELLAPTAKQQALTRCTQSGIVALTVAATAAEKEHAAHLADIFKKFFNEPEVGEELARLVRGEKLSRADLALLFAGAGYDARTLPQLNFEQALTAFETAFLSAAVEEPELRDILQAAEMLKQTHLQTDLLAAVRDLRDFLRYAHAESLSIQAGVLSALRAADNKPTSYEFRVVHDGPRMDWESHYLRTLAAQCEGLDLTPIDDTVAMSAGTEALSVSKVFTTLYLAKVQRRKNQTVAAALAPRAHEAQPTATGARKREASASAETEDKQLPISAVEAVAALPRVVILGQPGGGKSTLVHHLAAQLAYRRMGKKTNADKLVGWAPEEKPLPVVMVLRRFAAWLPSAQTRPSEGLVWDYLKFQLHDCGCEDAFTGVQQQLREHGGVIFFDGLDEVPESDAETKRTLLTQAIHKFAKPLDKCRVVITCREYAYRRGNEPWHLPEASFPVVELDLFQQEQIASFINTWYQAAGPIKGWNKERCANEAGKLIDAVQDWEHLRELAHYPLLLTLMAQVHGRDGYLPKDRADLYDRAVNLLLAHWENRLVRDLHGSLKVEPGLVLQLGIRTEILRNALERVAFTAHERQEKAPQRTTQAADIPREELREELQAVLGSFDKAETVMTYIQERAGLLQARDHRIYTFPHRTFQEYLAARYVLRQPEYDTLLRTLLLRDMNWWREVYLLAAGSVRNLPTNICNMVEALVAHDPEPASLARVNLEHVLLASQALHETEFVRHVRPASPEAEPDRFARVFVRQQNWLLHVLRADAHIVAKERARAGDMLAQLSDPREAVTTLEHMEFCLVPAGPFHMGSDDGDSDEKPQHLNQHLNYDFWLTRYPVTVAQYAQFVEATKHKPENARCLQDPANRPVRFVTWHEAIKFCEWLTQYWRAQNLLPQNLRVHLPSEAEWEKAARGGVQIPQPTLVRSLAELQTQPSFALVNHENSKRRFPWGDEADPNRANYDDTKIGETSAVGCFPNGVSPYGCEEMSGNVWEWTRSLKQDYPYDPNDGRENLQAGDDIGRVVRGGAFFNLVGFVRCSCRFRSYPNLRNAYIGFRIALSP